MYDTLSMLNMQHKWRAVSWPQIKHTDLFDETDHAVSVRSTEHTCTSKYFFWRSYVLKYPGIPKDCPRCRKDLLNHKSYHIKFHWTCKFCKFYQYKLYPKSAKELQEREIQEEKWYKSVCPFCDTKFIGPYQRKKHVELELLFMFSKGALID